MESMGAGLECGSAAIIGQMNRPEKQCYID
jgi:hypothetical protein